jgi:uncharacterized membrane protein
MQRRTILRGALAAGFVLAGTAHLARPDLYLPIMPRLLPRPLDLIYLSGACEIVGGASLLIPPLRRPASYGLIALLLAVFPANIQMAVNGFAQRAPWWALALLLARLPLQPVLIALAYLAGRDADRPSEAAPEAAS